MRAAWDKGLKNLDVADSGKYVTVEGSFDDFSKSGVKKGEVDMVVIAQAWHWCPDYDAALVGSSLQTCRVVWRRRAKKCAPMTRCIPSNRTCACRGPSELGFTRDEPS